MVEMAFSKGIPSRWGSRQNRESVGEWGSDNILSILFLVMVHEIFHCTGSFGTSTGSPVATRHSPLGSSGLGDMVVLSFPSGDGKG